MLLSGAELGEAGNGRTLTELRKYLQLKALQQQSLQVHRVTSKANKEPGKMGRSWTKEREKLSPFLNCKTSHRNGKIQDGTDHLSRVSSSPSCSSDTATLKQTEQLEQMEAQPDSQVTHFTTQRLYSLPNQKHYMTNLHAALLPHLKWKSKNSSQLWGSAQTTWKMSQMS